jgi:regulator of sigma E protease
VITTIVSFIFVLGVLIFFHELGHFMVAKKVGIKVERFSLGFPPYVFSKKRGETIYSIGLIPLGGFVKMEGENPDETATGAPGEFMSKSVGQRALVIFAGPLMNYLLALGFLIGIFFFSGMPVFDENRVVIGDLDATGPAATAGIRAEDEILSVNNQPIQGTESVTRLIAPAVAAPVSLRLLRGTDTVAITVTTQAVETKSESGAIDSIGRIGITLMPKVLSYERYNVFKATADGFIAAHVIVYKTAEFVKQLAFGQVSTRMLGGPVFIARQSGVEARKGASSLFYFMALLSINLAVLNILPIPVLDGGHLLFIAIEKIKGSPVSLRARLVAQQVGVIALLTLIVFITYNDILRELGAN